MQKWVWLLIASAIFGSACVRRQAVSRAVSWNAESGTFAWPWGQVNLPEGFTHTEGVGGDTDAGHFTPVDGKMIIRYDIGGYAGAWAGKKKSTTFRETVIEGARVWVAERDWPDGGGTGGNTTLVAVTFPDSGCANFFVTPGGLDEAKAIDLIARSFRPIGQSAQGSGCA